MTINERVLTNEDFQTLNAICFEMRKVTRTASPDVQEYVSQEIIPDFMAGYNPELGWGMLPARIEAPVLLYAESVRRSEKAFEEYMLRNFTWYQRLLHFMQIKRDKKVLRKLRRFTESL